MTRHRLAAVAGLNGQDGTTPGMSRRHLVASGGVLLSVLAGCGQTPQTTVQEALEDASTETLKDTRLALRGFQIVALRVGERLIRLPHPAVRVLGAVLVFTAAGAELVVEYLDVELQKRELRETLAEEVRMAAERRQSITAVTEAGEEETITLQPNQYRSE